MHQPRPHCGLPCREPATTDGLDLPRSQLVGQRRLPAVLAERPSDYRALLSDVQRAMLEWVADDPVARTARIEQSFDRIKAIKASTMGGPASAQ